MQGFKTTYMLFMAYQVDGSTPLLIPLIFFLKEGVKSAKQKKSY